MHYILVKSLGLCCCNINSCSFLDLKIPGGHNAEDDMIAVATLARDFKSIGLEAANFEL